MSPSKAGPPSAPQLLRIPEVAARLGISRTTVYDLIAAQRIAVYNVGTGRRPRLRISEADLADYLESARIPPRKSTQRAKST